MWTEQKRKDFSFSGRWCPDSADYQSNHPRVKGGMPKWLRSEQGQAEAIDPSFGLDKMVNKCKYGLHFSSRELCSSWTLPGLCGNTMINARLCTYGGSRAHSCFSKEELGAMRRMVWHGVCCWMVIETEINSHEIIFLTPSFASIYLKCKINWTCS